MREVFNRDPVKTTKSTEIRQEFILGLLSCKTCVTHDLICVWFVHGCRTTNRTTTTVTELTYPSRQQFWPVVGHLMTTLPTMPPPLSVCPGPLCSVPFQELPASPASLLHQSIRSLFLAYRPLLKFRKRFFSETDPHFQRARGGERPSRESQMLLGKYRKENLHAFNLLNEKKVHDIKLME